MEPKRNENLHIEIKQEDISEDGSFTGYLAVFDNVDSWGDAIKKGAFKKTLRERKQFTLFYQHDYDKPIGKFTGKEDGHGLLIDAELNLDLPLAQEVHSNLKKSILNGLSIGFDSVKWLLDKGVRLLKEVKLWEGSVVSFPANELALVTSVKSVVPYQDLPLADTAREWDSAAAKKRVLAWAGDDLDEASVQRKYQRGFVWYDREAADTLAAYKLPITDVIDGTLTAVPKGVFAAAAAVQGARGGVDIPESDMARVRSHLSRYYKKLDMTAPWDKGGIVAEKLVEIIGVAEVIKQSDDPAGCVDLELLDHAAQSLTALHKRIKATDGPGEGDDPHPPAEPGPSGDGDSEDDGGEQEKAAQDLLGRVNAFLKEKREITNG